MAAAIAAKSPVKWRLMSSIGIDLRIAAARGPAFHAEARAERGLAEADHRLPADPVERVAEADGGGGLALAGGRRRDRSDEDQPPVGAVEPAEPAEVDLGLERAVVVDGLARDAEAAATSTIGFGFAARAISMLLSMRPPAISCILAAEHHTAGRLAKGQQTCRADGDRSQPFVNHPERG